MSALPLLMCYVGASQKTLGGFIMSKVKRMVSILVTVAMVLSLSTPLTVHASTYGQTLEIIEITPFWQNVSQVLRSLSRRQGKPSDLS